MPNIKSATKRVSVTKKRTLENNNIKSKLKTSVKKFENNLTEKNGDDTKELFKVACKNIDKAASKNVIHKNAASRKKSKLHKKFNEINTN